MITMYNYNKRDEAFNDIVEEAVSFAVAQLENQPIENKEERIKNHNYAMAKYCIENTRVANLFEEKGLEALRDPRVYKCSDFLENYNVVLAEIINVILPLVANKDYARYLAEVRQVGWGDTALFQVKNNELYKVNEIAEGVNRGVLQPIFDNEFTVNAKKTEVAASFDWYPVAAGVFDFGDFGLRYARSFEAYIFLKIIKSMTTATNDLGAAYSATGFNNDNWSTLMQAVSAANGGSAVYAIGTMKALNKVLPDNSQLQIGLGQKIADDGFLDKYFGVKMIPVDQVFMPDGAVNTTGKMAIPDDIIYLVAADYYRPVKIVFEGNSSIVERDPDHTPDRTYWIRIQENVGVATIVGSKFGTLKLTSN